MATFCFSSSFTIFQKKKNLAWSEYKFLFHCHGQQNCMYLNIINLSLHVVAACDDWVGVFCLLYIKDVFWYLYIYIHVYIHIWQSHKNPIKWAFEDKLTKNIGKILFYYTIVQLNYPFSISLPGRKSSSLQSYLQFWEQMYTRNMTMTLISVYSSGYWIWQCDWQRKKNPNSYLLKIVANYEMFVTGQFLRHFKAK